MKKKVMTLLVACIAIWATPALAEDGGNIRKAIPDSAIETGNGEWSPPPSPSVVYTRRGRWISPASSTSGAYVSANIGAVDMNNVDLGNYYHYNTGVALLGAVGYGFKNNCRIEGEIGYQSNDNNQQYWSYSNRNISVVSFLANGYYDIPVWGIAQPYLTAGIGLANVNADGLNSEHGIHNIPSTNDTAFAYQFGLGITIPIGNNIKLDTRYRYFATNVIIDSVYDKSRFSSNSVLIGLKIGI